MTSITTIPSGTWELDPQHSELAFDRGGTAASPWTGRRARVDGANLLKSMLTVTGTLTTTARIEEPATQLSIAGTWPPKPAGRLLSLLGRRTAELPGTSASVTFRSTLISGDADHLRVDGQLSVKGRTIPALITGAVTTVGRVDAGVTRLGFTGTGTVERDGMHSAKSANAQPDEHAQIVGEMSFRVTAEFVPTA